MNTGSEEKKRLRLEDVFPTPPAPFYATRAATLQFMDAIGHATTKPIQDRMSFEEARRRLTVALIDAIPAAHANDEYHFQYEEGRVFRAVVTEGGPLRVVTKIMLA